MLHLRRLVKTNAELLKNNNTLQEIISHVRHIDERVSYKGYKPLRWGLGISGVSLFVYKDRINNMIRSRAKNLTHETIEDEKTKQKLQELFVQIINSPETKDALYTTFKDLFEAKESQESLAIFLKDSSIKAMNDKELRQSTVNYCWTVAKNMIKFW
jgi:hypothetical protein